MRYLDEFRDRKLVDALLAKIRRLGPEPARFMEVCGTHTVAIFRGGLRRLLGGHITLVSGPGCPVCVTAQADIDRMIRLARAPGVIITSFGDMLRVPGTESSLEKERAGGADIRVVYSPADALALARRQPDRRVVFLAVGFETTSPAVAAVLADAARDGVRNFLVYCCHKTIIPAMKTLMERGARLDGFLCPGHVSSIIGSRAYEPVCRGYRIPCVVSGFEPADILESVLLLLEQRKEEKPQVRCQYARAVRPEGNTAALRLIGQVFEPCDADWRGLGLIRGSGYALREKFSRFDARKAFSLPGGKTRENPRCRCGAVLCGRATPAQCGLFGNTCTPENPAGPCMVSSEGTCAAWYKYNRGPA